MYPSVILSGLASLASVASAQLSADDAAKCDCFATGGAASNLYTHHQIFDFRYLSQYVDYGVADPVSLVDDAGASALAPLTSAYFSTDEWASSWMIQSWDNGYNATTSPPPSSGDATLLMVNSPGNVYLERSPGSAGTYLVLRTARHGTFQSAAEIESVSGGYMYLSLRMRARTVGSRGACTAMFTYRDPGAGDGTAAPVQVQEADAEFLTRDPPDRAHYTNQPAYGPAGLNPAATRVVTLPAGAAVGDWAVHRLDWTAGRDGTVWSVDGETVARIRLNSPRDPSQIVFNSWSDGGSWSGLMDPGGAANLQIQWIEVAYNVSRDRGGRTCGTVCSIDDRPAASAAGPGGVGVWGRRRGRRRWRTCLPVLLAVGAVGIGSW